jgi:thiamine phosphate synthase YjbQ (UPF0047 family)
MAALPRTVSIAVGGLIAAALGLGWLLGARVHAPSLPPSSSSVTVVRPLPNVLLAVRDLAALETVSFHMERVIDLSEKQSRFFGLIETEDALLLVAVADVTAGVNLAKLNAEDVQADIKNGRAHVTLPQPEILHVTLDPAHTYVHTRKTGLLAQRQEQLESRARAEAEQALVEAAKQAQILSRAQQNAARVVNGLVRSLGYSEVEITFAN